MSIFESLFEGTEEEVLNQDSAPGGAKIDKSGIYLAKITMVKEMPGKKDDPTPRHLVIEMETESGAKLYDKIEWYKDATGVGHMSSKGNILPGAAKAARFNFLFTGIKDVPKLESASIKETQWEDNKPKEVTATRMVARGLIGQFVKVQVLRIRSNKQVDSGGKTPEGYAIWVDGAEERFTNDVRRYYDAATSQSVGEKQLAKPALHITEDKEYCEKTPVLDKYKAVAGNPGQTGGQQNQGQAGGFGGGSNAQNAGFGGQTGGFGGQ